MIGETILQYKILSKLGEGGMGVVYKAQDTKLDREVALKFLPAKNIATDEEKKRFEQEAKAAAKLSHAHIATVFDFNEHEDQLFIAMEYIDGESLFDKIQVGPLKLNEAIKIATQIADGLQAAHDKKISHRDIKSQNIMLTSKGDVKIMDFGLAKLSGRSLVTKEGTTLGTTAYMSPEQARGDKADHRTDIWSLGVVIYEMISGQLPFKGDYEQAAVYSILNEDPDPLTALRTGVPMHLEHVVIKCLMKDAGLRYQHAEELVVDLKTVAMVVAQGASGTSGASQSTTLSTAAHPGSGSGIGAVQTGSHPVSGTAQSVTAHSPSPIPWSKVALFTVLGILIGAAAMWFAKPDPPAEAKQVIRLTISEPTFERIRGVTITPDGSRLVYNGVLDNATQLFVRHLDLDLSEPIPGTENASIGFFSPDGQWLAFFRDRKMHKVLLSGGSPLPLADVGRFSSGTWLENGTIIYAAPPGALYQISESGGDPTLFLSPDSSSGVGFRGPKTIPGTDALTFRITSQYPDRRGIAVLDPDTKDYKIILNEGQVQYAPTGHLIFRRDGRLFAVPFDAKRLEMTGPEVPLLEDVGRFGFSRTGTLVYRGTSGPAESEQLVWVDLQGNETAIEIGSLVYAGPRVSPDGKRIAAYDDPRGDQSNIYLFDLGQDLVTNRLTFEGSNRDPVWSPDGRYVAYVSRRDGKAQLLRKRSDLFGTEDLLFQMEGRGGYPSPTSWSPDGKWLAFEIIPRSGDRDLWSYSFDQDTAMVFLNTRAWEGRSRFSPDGKWIAYQSDESDRHEIYVRSFQGASGKFQISENGGSYAIWAPDGKALYYSSSEGLMKVPVSTGDVFKKLGVPEVVFEKDDINIYNIHPDGERFLGLKPAQLSGRNEFHLVINWFEELKRLAPPGK